MANSSLNCIESALKSSIMMISSVCIFLNIELRAAKLHHIHTFSKCFIHFSRTAFAISFASFVVFPTPVSPWVDVYF